MSDNEIMKNLAKELNGSNSNIKSLIEVTQKQMQTHSDINDKNVKAFQDDRHRIMIGVDEIGKFVQSNNEAIQSNNMVMTNTISQVLTEFGGMRDGLKDVADHLKTLSDQLIEHRVQTTAWKDQNEREITVCLKSLGDIGTKLDSLKDEITEVKIDVTGLKTRQEVGRDLTSAKIDNVAIKNDTIHSTKEGVSTKTIAIVAVGCTLLGIALSTLKPSP